MCDIFGYVRVIFIVCPVAIIPIKNTSVCLIISEFDKPTEGVHRLWGMAKITRLHIYLKRHMTCLNLLQCLLPDSQISISAGISEGSRPNNDSYEGLSHFVGRCIISV